MKQFWRDIQTISQIIKGNKNRYIDKQIGITTK